MATYTHNEVADSPALAWIELTAIITSITADEVVLTNSDGTVSILTGSGFAGTTGAGGSLTSGTITTISRAASAGGVVFETVTGLNFSAQNFTTALQGGGLQGVAAAVLNGDDTLNGYSGADFFKGFAGNDTVNGGGGLDTIRYSGPFHSGAISVSLSATSTITGGATAGTDTLNSVEIVIGSNSGDTFLATTSFSGSAGSFNVFEGRGGDDTITGNGNTEVRYTEAQSGVSVNIGNTVVAGAASFSARSIAANDAANIGVDSFLLLGPSSPSILNVVGSGFGDVIVGNSLANTLQGGAGNDSIFAGQGNDTVFGGAGQDSVQGGADNDSINGGSDNDTLEGGGGINTLVGGGGTDVAVFGFTRASATIVHNADGSWTVTSGAISNTLTSIEYLQFSDPVAVSIRQGVNLHDFNGDRTSDVLLRDSSNGAVGIWSMANGSITTTGVPGAPAGWRVATTGDFDGNGRVDLLLANDATGAVTQWRLNGSTIESSLGLANLGASSPWQIIGSGDFNGDGTTDVVLRNETTGAVAGWQLGNGAIQASWGFGDVASSWALLGTGDLNNDGTTDMLWRDSATGQVAEWIVGNGAVTQGSVLGTVSSDWQFVGLGDLNGDGTSDVIWRNSTTGAVAEWLMADGQTASFQGLGVAASNWQAVSIGDYNGDGTSDILWRDSNTGSVSAWLIGDDGLLLSGGSVGVGNVSGSWSIISV